MTLIASSVLSADFSNLGKDIRAAEKAGTDWFHLDIMDGHFVPNISFGPLVIEAVRKITDHFLDVHLMIEEPDKYIPQFADAGANLITVHAEATRHLHRTINLIHGKKLKAGVAINPATQPDVIKEILPDIDLVLVMSVNPGFGGQSFIPHAINKIKRVADFIKEQHHKIHLEVDGGVDAKTAPDCVRAGADVLAVGSAIFARNDIAQAITELRLAIR